MRRRKILAYMILVLIERGKYASVAWTGPRSVLITTAEFAKAIGVQSHKIRQYMDFLKRCGYLTDLKISFGFIEATIAEAPKRYVEAAA